MARLAGLAIALVLTLGARVDAQSTGGSFGSSGFGSSDDWGSSSSSSDSWGSSDESWSSSSSSDSWGSSDESWSSSSSSGSSSGSSGASYAPRGPSPEELWHAVRVQRGSRAPSAEERAAVEGPSTPAVLRFWPSFLVLAFFAWNALRRRNVELPSGPGPSPFASRSAHSLAPGLARVSIAFAPEARRRLQQALSELASRAARTDPDRHWLARDVAALLRRELPSATHVYVETRAVQSGLEQLFLGTAQGLRARFRHETEGRGAATPELRARADEGEGFLVVSMVLADRRALPILGVPRDAAEVSVALEKILPLRGGLTAIDVIWSPSEELDRMSSLELERLYPELARLPGVVRVGERRCGACGARHAAELPRCPACGAPSPA